MKYLQKITGGLILSFLCISAFGQPSWTVNPALYQTSMSVTAQLNIEGEISAGENDAIGVFVGDECRGAATNTYVYNGKNYALLSIYGNTAGERLSLKIYEAASSKIYDLKQYFYFIKDTVMGTYDEPVVFYTDLTVKELVAFNFFSPNGDGKNDEFKVDDLIAVSGLTFKVMNRQGLVVFQQKDYDNLWQGKDKNDNDLPQGVYYYLFIDGSGKTIYKGSITLVR